MVIMGIAAVYMVVNCDDLMSIFAPVCFAIQLSVEFYKDYSALAVYAYIAAVPVCAAFAFGLIRYRRPFKGGKLFWPLIAVSCALFLGGVGAISSEEYFSPLSLYYMAALGPAQLLIYMLVRSRAVNKREYNRAERVCEVLYAAGLLFVFVIFCFYLRNAGKAAEKGIIFYKPRNYVASVLLLCIPSTCVLAKRGFRYVIGMLAMHAAIVFSGSRSGLLIGSFITAACLFYAYMTDKKHRKTYNIALPIIIALCCSAAVILPSLYAHRMADASEADSTRIRFIITGIDNFLSSPVFGIGVGNMKDIGIFKAHVAGWPMFYHNIVIQILSCTGLVGAAAYIWLFYSKLRVLASCRRKAEFYALVIAYAALFLMSLVNPGLWRPFPELAILTMSFALAESAAL